MEEKRLLCILIKNCNICNVGDDNIFAQDKNCYIVTKYGSMARPFICYDRRVGGKTIDSDMVIGGYTELINFLKTKPNSKIYFRGFNRSTIDKIRGLIIEEKKRMHSVDIIEKGNITNSSCSMVSREVINYNKPISKEKTEMYYSNITIDNSKKRLRRR